MINSKNCAWEAEEDYQFHEAKPRKISHFYLYQIFTAIPMLFQVDTDFYWCFHVHNLSLCTDCPTKVTLNYTTL